MYPRMYHTNEHEKYFIKFKFNLYNILNRMYVHINIRIRNVHCINIQWLDYACA